MMSLGIAIIFPATASLPLGAIHFYGYHFFLALCFCIISYATMQLFRRHFKKRRFKQGFHAVFFRGPLR